MPPASPSASSAAPWAACLDFRSNPFSIRTGPRSASARAAGAPVLRGAPRRPGRKHDLIGLRSRHGQLTRQLHRALDVTPPAPDVLEPGLPRRDGLDPPANRSRFDHLPGQERHLSVQTTGGAPSDRSAGPATPSTTWPSSTATPAVNAPPSSSRISETSSECPPGGRAGPQIASAVAAELVRRAQIHPVELPVPRHGVEMRSTPGMYTTGSPDAPSTTREAADAPDAAGLAGRRQERQTKILVASPPRPGEAAVRTPRARPRGPASGPRPAAPRPRRGSATALGGRPRLRRDRRRPSSRPQKSIADRARVDTHDAGHAVTSSAEPSPAPPPRSPRHPARGRCG